MYTPLAYFLPFWGVELALKRLLKKLLDDLMAVHFKLLCLQATWRALSTHRQKLGQPHFESRTKQTAPLKLYITRGRNPKREERGRPLLRGRRALHCAACCFLLLARPRPPAPAHRAQRAGVGCYGPPPDMEKMAHLVFKWPERRANCHSGPSTQPGSATPLASAPPAPSSQCVARPGPVLGLRMSPSPRLPVCR
jgi:hypothetical protein